MKNFFEKQYDFMAPSGRLKEAPMAFPWLRLRRVPIHVRLKFAQMIPHIRDVARNLPREWLVDKKASTSRIKGQTSILRGKAKGKRLEGKAEVL